MYGVKTFFATASIGAALVVGAPSAHASDPGLEYFGAYSSVSYDDARASAVALAADWGYTICRAGMSHWESWGNPVEYYVEVACS
jgi:hypothetical protein